MKAPPHGGSPPSGERSPITQDCHRLRPHPPPPGASWHAAIRDSRAHTLADLNRNEPISHDLAHTAVSRPRRLRRHRGRAHDVAEGPGVREPGHHGQRHRSRGCAFRLLPARGRVEQPANRASRVRVIAAGCAGADGVAQQRRQDWGVLFDVGQRCGDSLPHGDLARSPAEPNRLVRSARPVAAPTSLPGPRGCRNGRAALWAGTLTAPDGDGGQAGLTAMILRNGTGSSAPSRASSRR